MKSKSPLDGCEIDADLAYEKNLKEETARKIFEKLEKRIDENCNKYRDATLSVDDIKEIKKEFVKNDTDI